MKSFICNYAYGPWGHYAKWNVGQRKANAIWSHLYMKPKEKNIRKMKLIDKASQIKYIIYSLKWNEHSII